ncbi:hypothetical protein BDN67DRAFT_967718 [Paxillus ammoniavirescens]|nr:hypothetical protein BDN67DRAFT_967718 [Paxillus ammoniavirescens]
MLQWPLPVLGIRSTSPLRYHDSWRGRVVTQGHNGLHLNKDIFAGMNAFRRPRWADTRFR